MKKSIFFNYLSDRYYRIVFGVCMALFFGLSFVYLYFVTDLFTGLFYILMTLVVLSIFLLFIRQKIEVTAGLFEFDQSEFRYTTFKSTYSILYDEIKSIEKRSYYQESLFNKIESYYYLITLKEGTFTFKAYDEELDYAILELSKITHLTIQ